MPKMLPALPQAFGNLKDVFRSAHDSLLGRNNPLGLAKSKNALVILVDGLGWNNLNDFAGHAPFLKKHMHKSAKGYSAFPSTTATSIMTFATGVSPSEHGFIGYRVFDRQKAESVNLLTGLDPQTVNEYRKTSIIAQSASQVVVVSKPEYLASGFSEATFGGSKFLSASEIDERFKIAVDELNSGSGKLIYLYVPELDQAAHRFGCASAKWIALLELVDTCAKRISAEALPGRGIILTADHGVIDVPQFGHIYLDECDELTELIEVGGDPRATFLYFTSESDVDSKQLNLIEWLNGRGDAYTIRNLVDMGLYQDSIFNFGHILPDLVILAGANQVCYHRDYAKPASLAMVGQHGGVTETEITVPILRLAGYSSSLLVP